MIEATRRQAMGGLAAAALVGPAMAQGGGVAFAMPDGACDCHHHLYDPRWAYLPDAINKPPFATLADYRKQVQKRLGFTRDVIVQPSTYGLDNSCLLDALKQQGRIGHVAAEGADLIQRRAVGHQAVAAHPAVGGLKPHHAAEGRRLADRAAGVAPQGSRAQPGRGGRGRDGRPRRDAAARERRAHHLKWDGGKKRCWRRGCSSWPPARRWS